MKLVIFSLLSFVLLLLNFCTNAQSYGPNWSELNSRPLPLWYDDVKFGIFIHFGLYSVPAFSYDHGYAEWYWYCLIHGCSDHGQVKAYHDKNFGSNFTYQDFAPMFSCRDFNSDDWASIIEKSGAKYVVLTSKHHEGYTLWDSPQAWNWNSVETGPHKNIVGELTNSVKKLGLHMGLYHSIYEWFNPLYVEDKASGTPPKTNNYVEEVLSKQLIDMVEQFEPEVIWADGAWDQLSTYWRTPEFLSWLYTNSTVKDTVVVNDRWGSECVNRNGGFFTGGDNFSPLKLQDHKWENCATIGYSYGFNENEPAIYYQNTTEILHNFVTTVSCGGNFLLDVGPDAEGTIPDNMVDRLLDIGLWLSVNGESIYGSSPWRVQNQTYNIWYTTNTTNEYVYAFLFELPESGVLTLNDPIGNKKTTATLLGLHSDKPVSVLLPNSHKKPGITLEIPFVAPQDYPPFGVYVIRLCNVK